MYDVNPVSEPLERQPVAVSQLASGSAQRTVALILIFVTVAAYLFPEYTRMYWPYMLSSYLLAVGVYVWERYKYPAEEKTSLIGYLFPAKSWLHRSTVQDCFMSLLNLVLIAWVFSLPFAGPVAFEDWTESATRYVVSHFSGLKPTPAPTAWAVAAYTFLSLLVMEFFDYWSHRMLHKVPALWEFHKVHHSAQVLTPVTAFRLHPFDVWYTMAFRAVGFGLPAGVFLYFYPDMKGVATVAGVNVLVFTAQFVGANLRHSHIWLRFHPTVEHVIVSPVMHQIHHSANPKHFDKNFGTHLTIWDWAFGSLYVPEKRETLKFGLGNAKMEEPYLTFWSSFMEPFRQLGKWFR